MPTETSDDEEKDGFFDALERPYDNKPKKSHKNCSQCLSCAGRYGSSQFSHSWQLQSLQSYERQRILADTFCSITEHDHGIKILPM